jgi:hypothetical protein
MEGCAEGCVEGSMVGCEDGCVDGWPVGHLSSKKMKFRTEVDQIENIRR